MRKVWVTKRKGVPGKYVEWYDDNGRRRSKYFLPKYKKYIKPFMARKFAELNSDVRRPGSYIGIPWIDFVKNYVHGKKVKGLADNSIYQIENTVSHFKRLCSPSFTDTVKQTTIDKFITARRAEVKAHTLKKDLRNLRALLSYGQERFWVDPKLAVPTIKAQDKPIKVLSDNEVRRLIRACGDDRQWRMRILLAVCTGLRRSDLDRLKLAHVDVEHKTITTTNRKTGKATNYQPLPDAIMPEIERFICEEIEDGQVLYFKHKWSKKWQTIIANAKLTKITPHDLRRTFGSMQADAGVPIKALQEMYNHSSIETTMKHYIKTKESEKRIGVNKLKVNDWL